MAQFLFTFFWMLSGAVANELEMVPTETLIFEAASKAPKRGGGSSSIGADSYDVRLYTGWFYGKKPIVTCYNSLSNFGVSNKEIESTIKQSIKVWQDYFKEKVLVSGKKSDLDPNLNFKFRGKCKGEEDLALYFGAGPIFGNIQDLKAAQTLQSPVAYANKTQMRRDLKWSKGYIRFINHGEYSDTEPNWKKPKALEAILIHELGHILGFAHTPHTIMSSEVIDQVNSQDDLNLSIDQGKQLVTCESCKEVYTLASKDSGAILEQFGLNLKKPVRLIKQGTDLTLTDGKITVVLQDPKLSNSEKKQTLFTNFSTSLNQNSQTANIYGKMNSKEGKLVPVVVEYNSIDQQGGLALRTVSVDGFENVVAFKK